MLGSLTRTWSLSQSDGFQKAQDASWGPQASAPSRQLGRLRTSLEQFTTCQQTTLKLAFCEFRDLFKTCAALKSNLKVNQTMTLRIAL